MDSNTRVAQGGNNNDYRHEATQFSNQYSATMINRVPSISATGISMLDATGLFDIADLGDKFKLNIVREQQEGDSDATLSMIDDSRFHVRGFGMGEQ